MEKSIKVAVIRGNRRRGAVAEALALLAPELAELAARDHEPVVIPDLQNPGRPWSCTHHDVLSATVDAVLAAGASSVNISGGVFGPDERPGNPARRLGYAAELWGRPARFLVHDPEPESWTPIHWIGPRGEPLSARVHPKVAASRCRISLAVAKTHETFRVGLGLANLGSCFHPADLLPPGLRRNSPRLRSRVGSALTALLETGRGRMVGAWLGLRGIGGGMRLTPGERRHLECVAEAADRLVALASFLKPALSLIDGFSAMHGEGPRHGTQVGLNTIIAGTDVVAVDAVEASIMGFEPMEIACLREAQRMGLGIADLSRITILGDPPVRPRRKVKRHSADPLLRLAEQARSPRPSPPRPHFELSPAELRERSDAHRS